MIQIELSHEFQSAHRLNTPDAPAKCKSIHGHSWWVTVTIEGERLDENGMLVEFGAFKTALRTWIDKEVCHRLILKYDDPIIDALRAVDPHVRFVELDYPPTTEVIAKWIFERCEQLLHEDLDVAPSHARIQRVHIKETCLNAASYSRPTSRAD